MRLLIMLRTDARTEVDDFSAQAKLVAAMPPLHEPADFGVGAAAARFRKSGTL